MGIQETKELLVAVDEVALQLVKGFKKGGAFGTFGEFFNALQNDPAFKAALEAAWDKHNQIPAELADLSMMEMLELGGLELSYVPKFIDALKG
jgi:hypothetical protein